VPAARVGVGAERLGVAVGGAEGAGDEGDEGGADGVGGVEGEAVGLADADSDGLGEAGGRVVRIGAGFGTGGFCTCSGCFNGGAAMTTAVGRGLDVGCSVVGRGPSASAGNAESPSGATGPPARLTPTSPL
jgi:hypothetical protein